MFNARPLVRRSPHAPVVTPRHRIALVLAGCGAKDGAEITESVSLLIAFAQAGFETHVFAPNRPVAHVIEHRTFTEAQNETRNILTEAARIARGRISPISALRADDFDALAFAGGFGAAKNLCTFAFAGKDATLHADVKDALLPFLRAGKPVAALCIAPVLLALGARELGVRGARLTLGDGSGRDAVTAIQAWGASHVPTPVDQACVDETFRLVTAPAYMYDSATPADIFASATALTQGVRTLLQSRRP